MKFADLFTYTGLGILLSAVVVYLHSKLGGMNGATWKAWGAGVLGILLVVLSLAWAYASMQEHEMQAAWMGLFVFGVPGIVFTAGAIRMIKKGAGK